MKVTRISFNIFKGRIIDTHAHVGHLNNKVYRKEDLDIFVKEPLPNNDYVEKMIVSDLDVLHSLNKEYDGNKSLINALNSDKYLLLASCSPKDGNVNNIKKLFKENPGKFVGLKFHPSIQNLAVNRAEYNPYLDFGAKNNIPCLFHTEVLTDNTGKLIKETSISDPKSIYNLAKKYKKLPIVLAHLGAGWKEAHDKAIDVLVQSIKNQDANLYADISWVDIDAKPHGNEKYNPKEHVVKAIKVLKGIGNPLWKYGDQSYRLMFGTDAPIDRFQLITNKNAVLDYTKFIEEIKHAIRSDIDLKSDAEKIIDDIFYNNAKKLYAVCKVVK